MVDDELIERAMHLYGLGGSERRSISRSGDSSANTRRERDMEGIGWEGDLEEMRRSRIEEF